MKKFVLLALLMSAVLSASAQYVTIPDTNFVNYLNYWYPECMDGNLMDTTCEAIVNDENVYLNNLNSPEAEKIADLTGIQYFTSLENLSCQGNVLTELPELPDSLMYLNCSANPLSTLPDLPQLLISLYCYDNNLTVLPELPNSLEYLNCRDNNLTMLPVLSQALIQLNCNDNILSTFTELPPSLETLRCNNNNLSALPQLPQSMTYMECNANNLTTLPELPQSLTHLQCRENILTTLPELPQSLESLKCDENNLTTLPELPPSLSFLDCPNNQLTSLPDLPLSLITLDCRSNQLDSLPELPSSLTYMPCTFNNLTSLPTLPPLLTTLSCSYNNLTSLPELPDSLTKLFCYNNNLTTLPKLPQTLTQLHCQDNQITCLPTLPMSLDNNDLTQFSIFNNQFTCLPNYVPAMDGGPNEQWLAYPLCDLSDLDNNPYGCSSLEGIAGTVFQDDNTNCEGDENESGLINVPLQLLDENMNLLATTSTFSNYKYNFVSDTGTFITKLVHENLPFQPSCENPGDTQEVILTAEEPSALGVDFGVDCLTDFDLGAQTHYINGWVFPGQTHSLQLFAGDISNWYGLLCAAGINGSVIVNIDGPVSYVGPTDNALLPDISGDIQLTYEIADFGNINFEESFGVILETDTTAQTDDLICVEVIVEPIQGDANPQNNIYTHCYEVVNSYDPNIKLVWPQDVEPGYDGYFNYTINFQNTGTAPAFNIRLADTLDTNLDLSTFQVTGYSHDCLTYVQGNVATFRFNNIMLPDSTSDFDGSIGYVQYRIKPIADLPVGTIIENTAHIFFDFNDAIVTNTTQNEFVITTSVADRTTQSVQVFPNPGTGMYNVSLKNAAAGTSTMEVFTLSGVRVAQQALNNRQTVLDLTQQPPGMYLLRVQNEIGSEVIKIVKH